MKILYVKYRDPMLFNRPNENIYDEDLDKFKPALIRDAGILLKEDDERIWFGETHVAEDNPELDEWGIRHPYYRNVRVIHKSQVIERREFQVSEDTKE